MSINILPLAELDIEGTADDIRQRSGDPAAETFIRRTTRTLELLERLPHMGHEPDPPYPRYPGMRRFLVQKQRYHVIYYVPIPGGIRVVRVVHAARDADALFR